MDGRPTFGSLFTGIGGIDLGFERAGWKCKWQVENDDYCTRILQKHWPKIKRYGDIYDINKDQLEKVDLICGGFPCQPVSQAGRRKGREDHRWLWPQFHETICAVRPEWVLVENVPGLLSIDSGRIFGDIIREMAEIGYDAYWGMLRASDLGAPHLRERIFIIAHSNDHPIRRIHREHGQRQAMSEDFPQHEPGQVREPMADTKKLPIGTGPGQGGEERIRRGRSCDSGPQMADSSSQRTQTLKEILREEHDPDRGGEVLANTEGGESREPETRDRGKSFGGGGEKDMADPPCDTEGYGNHGTLKGVRTDQEKDEMGNSISSRFSWIPWWRTGPEFEDRLTQYEERWRTDPAEGPVESRLGRVAYGIPNRMDRLRGLGNAVVPQVAEYLGLLIMEVIENEESITTCP